MRTDGDYLQDYLQDFFKHVVGYKKKKKNSECPELYIECFGFTYVGSNFHRFYRTHMGSREG